MIFRVCVDPILLSGGFDGTAISVTDNLFFVGRTVVFLLGVAD